MKPIQFTVSLSLLFVLFVTNINAQTAASCKVAVKELIGSYTGDCRNELANGTGEARGTHRYKGTFKDGMPNGTGVYYYADSEYYDGSFQNGIKEGKGEMHYIKKGVDSLIKGYWSGGEYRGKKYVTYNFSTTETFDRTDITPSSASGNSVTIEISTTSGSPAGANVGFVISLSNLISPTSSIQKMTNRFDSPLKSSATYELISFPCKLFGTLSDGRTFELELYKAADWKVRFYKNI